MFDSGFFFKRSKIVYKTRDVFLSLLKFTIEKFKKINIFNKKKRIEFGDFV